VRYERMVTFRELPERLMLARTGAYPLVGTANCHVDCLQIPESTLRTTRMMVMMMT